MKIFSLIFSLFLLISQQARSESACDDIFSSLKKPKTLIAAGVVATGAAALGVAWGLKKTPFVAEVVDMSWEHWYTVEEFRVTTKDDWEKDLYSRRPVMPVNGSGEVAGIFNIRNCRSRHYDDEEYVCGSYRDSNGETKDKKCKRPRYKSYCDYDTYVWREVRSPRISGGFPEVGKQLPWPENHLGPYERSFSHAKYVVSYSYQEGEKKKVYDYTFKEQSEFFNWKKNDSAILNINHFGFSGVPEHTKVEPE